MADDWKRYESAEGPFWHSVSRGVSSWEPPQSRTSEGLAAAAEPAPSTLPSAVPPIAPTSPLSESSDGDDADNGPSMLHSRNAFKRHGSARYHAPARPSMAPSRPLSLTRENKSSWGLSSDEEGDASEGEPQQAKPVVIPNLPLQQLHARSGGRGSFVAPASASTPSSAGSMFSGSQSTRYLAVPDIVGSIDGPAPSPQAATSSSASGLAAAGSLSASVLTSARRLSLSAFKAGDSKSGASPEARVARLSLRKGGTVSDRSLLASPARIGPLAAAGAAAPGAGAAGPKSLAAIVAAVMPGGGAPGSASSSAAAGAAGGGGGGSHAHAAAPHGASGVKSFLEKLRKRADEKANAPHLELSQRGAMGIPVRDLLQALYARKRNRTILEALLFIAWAALFFGLIFSACNVQAFNEQNGALMDRFVDDRIDTFSWPFTFRDVGDSAEWWAWARTSLYSGAYETTDLGRGKSQPLIAPGVPYANGVLRLLGLTLRQVRVKSTTCGGPPVVADIACASVAANLSASMCTSVCYNGFTPEDEDRSPFNVTGLPTLQWSSGWSDIQGLYGWGPGSYGNGGYAMELPTWDAAAANATLEALEAGGWISAATRVVVADVTLYNPSGSFMSVARLQFEMLPTGLGMPSWRFWTFPISTEESTWRLVAEILYVAFLFIHVQKSLRQMFWTRPFYAYFSRLSTVSDFALITMTLLLVPYWLLFHSQASLDSVNVRILQAGHLDLVDVGRAHTRMLAAAGLTGLIGAIRCFKYLSLSRKVSVLWLTLGRATPLLLAFFVGFALIVAAFGFLSLMLFGTTLPAFHSFGAATSTLLRMSLGELDYDSLSQSQPELAPAYASAFVFLIYLVSLNMIVAIILQSFSEVSEELRRADKWKLSVITLDAFVVQRVTLFLRGNCDIFKRFCRATKRKLPPGCCKSPYLCAKGCRVILRGCLCCCCPRNPDVVTAAAAGIAMSPTGLASESPPKTPAGTSNPLAGVGSGGSSPLQQAKTGPGIVPSQANPMHGGDRKGTPADASAASTEGRGGSVTRRGSSAAVRRSLTAQRASSRSPAADLDKHDRAWAHMHRQKSVAKIAVVVGVAVDDAEAYAQEEARRARQMVADERQLELWRREAIFMKALNKVFHMAKRGRGVDLYAYLEKQSLESHWDAAYLGVHELCVLSNPLPCAPGQHATCAARALVDAYQRVKTVHLFGGVHGAYRHVPSSSYVNKQGLKLYQVEKTNVSGVKQQRLLCVDASAGVLVNFDRRMRVKKKLPLTQLLQIESYDWDPVRLNLVFSSNGASLRGAGSTTQKQLDELLETCYALQFMDATARVEFVEELTHAMEYLPRLLAGETDDAAASGIAGAAMGGSSADVLGAPGSGNTARSTGSAPSTPLPEGGSSTSLPVGRVLAAGRSRLQKRGSLSSTIIDAAREQLSQRSGGVSASPMVGQVLKALQEQGAAIQQIQSKLAPDPATPSAAAGRSAAASPAAAAGSGVDRTSLALDSLLLEMRAQRDAIQSLASKVAALSAAAGTGAAASSSK